MIFGFGKSVDWAEPVAFPGTLNAASVGDVFATIDQAPVGTDIATDVLVGVLTTLMILDGQTVSCQAVLGAITASTEIPCDLTTVGTTFPGASLAVVVRT